MHGSAISKNLLPAITNAKIPSKETDGKLEPTNGQNSDYSTGAERQHETMQNFLDEIKAELARSEKKRQTEMNELKELFFANLQAAHCTMDKDAEQQCHGTPRWDRERTALLECAVDGQWDQEGAAQNRTLIFM